jgi:hypothetical protein
MGAASPIVGSHAEPGGIGGEFGERDRQNLV